MALSHEDTLQLYVALTLVLLLARLLGEMARLLKQPSVMGELVAGILLGATCLGYISPSFFNWLFGPSNNSTNAFLGVTSICSTMYMLVAGLEMNLKNALKKKRAALMVGFSSAIIPFVAGFGFAYGFPSTFGCPAGANALNYALFAGTAMAITALPVAAKTLKDLHLFRTELGVVVISAAVLDDVLGWSLFAVVLSVANIAGNSSIGVAPGIIVSIVYVICVLTLGSFVVHRSLPYIQAYLSFPAGELGFICLFAFASASFALYVGLHNTLGAFIVGAAIGNSSHFRSEMKETLDTFVSFMLAPIFFGSVCLYANFATDFDAVVVFSIFFVACFGKLLGGFIGAKLARTRNREAFAIAVCMNARGAMELILAQVALQVQIIDGKMFVALVFLAIVTSILPGPLLRWILRQPDVPSFGKIIPSRGFHQNLQVDSLAEGIKFLAHSLGQSEIANVAVERELAKYPYYYDGVCISSVYSNQIRKPLVAVGMIHPDHPVRIIDETQGTFEIYFIFLLIIPEGREYIEINLQREISSLFSYQSFRRDVDQVKGYVEFKALVQIGKFRAGLATEHQTGPDTQEEEEPIEELTQQNNEKNESTTVTDDIEQQQSTNQAMEVPGNSFANPSTTISSPRMLGMELPKLDLLDTTQAPTLLRPIDKELADTPLPVPLTFAMEQQQPMLLRRDTSTQLPTVLNSPRRTALKAEDANASFNAAPIIPSDMESQPRRLSHKESSSLQVSEI